ncbi:VCBS domain-containing protein, partial [Novosphingobium sp. KCTC 2891]|uniref:VCBS domain-containing protein n=1 Tax=Novosphingobium sp. KCTC 2891 TaxID=2989730 RepID=UPI002222D079
MPTTSTPAKTSVKVALTNNAAKDDFFTWGENSTTLDGWSVIDVLGNDPGSAKIFSLGSGTTTSGQMVASYDQAVTFGDHDQFKGKLHLGDGQIAFKLDDLNSIDALAEGETVTFTFSYTAKMANGTLSTANVTITIVGANDPAVITGLDSRLLVETNSALSTGGKLDATDVDSSAAFVVQTNVAGDQGYGKFSIAADGTWTYAANNAHDEFK